MLKTTHAFVLVTTLALAGTAHAQGIKRTPLQDVKYPAGHHIVTVIAEIGPSQLAGRHTQGVHGPKDLTFTEAAAILSEATGHPIAYQEVPDSTFHDGLLKAGMPPKMADEYLQMYVGLRDGYTPEDRRSFVTTTPTTLGSWAYETLRPALG